MHGVEERERESGGQIDKWTNGPKSELVRWGMIVLTEHNVHVIDAYISTHNTQHTSTLTKILYGHFSVYSDEWHHLVPFCFVVLIE